MRHMALLALLSLFLALGANAGGRRLQQSAAPAPGPAPSEPNADLLFTIAAARATLNTTSLQLINVAPVVTYFSSQSTAGVYTTSEFTSTSAGAKFVTAGGQWLESPNAVLRAVNGTNNQTTALLVLASPQYNQAANTLTFKINLQDPANATTQLHTSGGVTDRLVSDARQGLDVGNILKGAAAANEQLTDVAVFIDESSTQLNNTAVSEYWHRHWGGGYYGPGWGYGWGPFWWGK